MGDRMKDKNDAQIRAGFALIASNAAKITSLVEHSNRVLDSIRPLLEGREIEGSYVAASLKGKYAIRYVELNYNATEVHAFGLKILSGKNAGLKGRQTRELGHLTLRRLGIKEDRNA